MTTAAAMLPAKYPAVALTPSQMAAAAPGNETTAKVWPTKLWRRRTMHQPMTAPSPAAAAPAASGPPLVLSWRSPVQVKTGQEFNVALMGRTGQPVGTLPINLHFDPAAFAVVKVAEGEFMKPGGVQTDFSSDVDTAGGRIAIGIAQPGGRGSGGGGTILTVTLKALAPTEKTDISISSATPSTPAGAAMALTAPPALTIRVTE